MATSELLSGFVLNEKTIKYKHDSYSKKDNNTILQQHQQQPPTFHSQSCNKINTKQDHNMAPTTTDINSTTSVTISPACTVSKYVNLGSIGEGSYGLVLKCRNRITGKLVAIKKFIESEEDKSVKKIAMREIYLLKQLRHENLVNLIEVFRRKKRLYLVFEFVDKTLLHYLEQSPRGLDKELIKRILYQVIKALEFCHIHNIIHRDVKPENVLITKWGIVKLCDFGFARIIAKPGEAYTEYVATRWYRAPELLVGDARYGRAVDIWALGCLHAEMMTGQPLFPGDSDLDQLFNILKCFGGLCRRHEDRLKNRSSFRFEISQVQVTQPLHLKIHNCTGMEYQFISTCLELDPKDRPTCSQLLLHPLFTHDSFHKTFPDEMLEMMRNDEEEEMKSSQLCQTTKPRRLLPDPKKCLQQATYGNYSNNNNNNSNYNNNNNNNNKNNNNSSNYNNHNNIHNNSNPLSFSSSSLFSNNKNCLKIGDPNKFPLASKTNVDLKNDDADDDDDDEDDVGDDNDFNMLCGNNSKELDLLPIKSDFNLYFPSKTTLLQQQPPSSLSLLSTLATTSLSSTSSSLSTSTPSSLSSSASSCYMKNNAINKDITSKINDNKLLNSKSNNNNKNILNNNNNVICKDLKVINNSVNESKDYSNSNKDQQFNNSLNKNFHNSCKISGKVSSDSLGGSVIKGGPNQNSISKNLLNRNDIPPNFNNFITEIDRNVTKVINVTNDSSRINVKIINNKQQQPNNAIVKQNKTTNCDIFNKNKSINQQTFQPKILLPSHKSTLQHKHHQHSVTATTLTTNIKPSTTTTTNIKPSTTSSLTQHKQTATKQLKTTLPYKS